jgi:hypothetical protein
MGERAEHLADARRTNGELKVSLGMLEDNIKAAQTALSKGNVGGIRKALDAAAHEVSAAREYQALIADSHRSIGRTGKDGETIHRRFRSPGSAGMQEPV